MQDPPRGSKDPTGCHWDLRQPNSITQKRNPIKKLGGLKKPPLTKFWKNEKPFLGEETTVGEGTKAADVRRESSAQLQTNFWQLWAAGHKGGTGRPTQEDPRVVKLEPEQQCEHRPPWGTQNIRRGLLSALGPYNRSPQPPHTAQKTHEDSGVQNLS